MPAPSLVADLEFRGLWFQEAGAGLRGALEAGPLTVYIGFDPTADSLHLGHLMQMCTLRRFQLAGHRPIALAGGATGAIGDPGGKSEERNLLDPEQLHHNLLGIKDQLERFVTFGGDSAAVLANNGDWFDGVTYLDFLRQVGKHFSVNEMIKKESVASRIERPEQGISYTEFSYMLMQAYDYLQLFDAYDCRLQMGGSDQFGNITMGMELVRKLRGAEVFGLTTPLVLKADGTKFGKTESGTVWLDPRRTSPYAFYQFFLRTEDADVAHYLRYFTFLDHERIVELDGELAADPAGRTAQRQLAREVCTLVHGTAETERAERAAAALFSEAIGELDEQTLLEVCADAPSSTRPRAALDDGVLLVDVLADSALVGSKSQARTTVSQGGAYVNNRRVDDIETRLTRADLLFDRYVVLRRGRRDYHLVRFE